MIAIRGICVAACVGVVTLAGGSPTRAQLMDQLKGIVQPGQSGGSGLGSLGGGGLPAVGQASTSNTAGVLQYCMRNNYLSGGSVGSVKDSLLGKVTGSGQGTNDSGYRDGSNGVLQTGNGQSYSLGGGAAGSAGGGIKEQATLKVCDMVLQHGKSLL